MSARASVPQRLQRGLAVAALVLTVALAAGSVVLSVLLRERVNVSDVGWLGGQAAFALVGVLILLRQPHNLIGRILAASGIFALLQALLWRYAALAFEVEPGMPFGVVAGWLANWVYVPMFPLFIVLLPLYFPNGRLPSQRWRPIVWLTGGLTLFVTLYLATVPGVMEDFPVENPFALAITARLSNALDSVGGDDVLISGFMMLALAAVVSVVLRYRRAHGVERLQIKWFVWAIAFFVSYLLFSAVLLEVILNRPTSTISDLVGLVCLLFVPVSIGAAVLRYRLYEIDRIISRTVSYGLLTVFLAAIYLLAVTGLTSMTASAVGDSPLAVAAATLLAAAAFRPTRRAIQAGVDRRFNRSRFDAQQMIQGFASRTRDQVDLETLGTELVDLVGVTMQPAKSLLWLREPV